MPEERNPLSKGLDTLATGDLLQLMHEEDLTAYHAVGMALKEIKRAVEDAIHAVRSGGRVVYAGAGTSGRLCVLDASEVPPTFGCNAFEAIIAGGDEAIRCAVEGAEDDSAQGACHGRELSGKDMAVGISASGRTPFVLGFLEAAKERGAKCWILTSEPVEPVESIKSDKTDAIQMIQRYIVDPFIIVDSGLFVKNQRVQVTDNPTKTAQSHK